jgi:hypothetical protein
MRFEAGIPIGGHPGWHVTVAMLGPTRQAQSRGTLVTPLHYITRVLDDSIRRLSN